MDYLPLLPPGAGCQAALAAALGASSQAQGRRPPRISPGAAEDPRGARNLVRPGGDGEQEVSILQRLKQSQVPTHPASEPSGGASPRSAGRGSATPHPGPAPEVHAGGARARARGSSWALLGPAQPFPPGAGRGLHAARRPARIGVPGRRRRRGAGLPGLAPSNSPAAGLSPAEPSARRPSVCPSVLWARPLGLWAARRPPLRTVITSGETPNSSRGRARLSSTPPGGVGWWWWRWRRW